MKIGTVSVAGANQLAMPISDSTALLVRELWAGGPDDMIAAMAVANTSAVAGNVSEHLGMPRGIRVGAVEVLRHLMPPLRRTRQRGPRGKPFGPRGAADGHLQVLSPLGQ